MTDYVAQIKDALPIETLIGKTLTLAGRGHVLTTTEHDSLKIWPATQSWYWFSRGIGGDIFDWYRTQQGCDFRTALEDLARLTGVDLAPLTPARRQELSAQRERADIFSLAAQWFHQELRATTAAVNYCYQRGWSDGTISHFRLGFSGVAHDLPTQPPLSIALRMANMLDTNAARAVLSIPCGMLIYPHVHQDQGLVVYLSARSLEGKRHYNLPVELAGPKRFFTAPALVGPARPGARILVEGQADAISLAQLGFDAVALCGAQAHDLPPSISHVALDNDPAGVAKALTTALTFGPLARIVIWPENYLGQTVNGKPAKDANDLLRAGATTAFIGNILDQADSAIMTLAAQAKSARGDDRQTLIRQLGATYRALDELTRADMAPDLAHAMGAKLSHFKRLMRAADDEAFEAEDRESPERYENSAGAVVGGVIFEQCVTWDETGTPTCTYAVRQPDGRITMQPVVDAGGVSFVPYPASIDLIRKRVVLFPSAAADFGSQQALMAEIRAFIHRWLDIDSFYEQLASYYVMFTWLYDLFETLPYLRALGDYGTGKSRFLQTVGVLCYRPMFVSGASTASPIFRVIDMFRGTLVVDEADFANSDAEAEIIKIVNVGYARGGVVLRAEKDPSSDTYYPSAKDVFGPKILATRRLFQDRATESRCLTKRMSTARPRPDIPRLLSRQFWAEAENIRNKLLMYRLRNHRAMDVDPALSDFSIEPRLDQVTLVLKSIITDEGMREQISTFVRAYNSTLISDRQMSVPAVVVQVLADTWQHLTQTLTGDEWDWSIKGISDRVKSALEALDPDEKMNPRRLSSILTEDLGLTQRGQDARSRRATLTIDEPALHALMNRYGVDFQP